tara:strand:+ start:121 stop:276 length:156 start_codon:yes stop_codon:yes gene_type:complete
MPNKQNNITFIFTIALPIIKLIGKKPKTRLVNKTELNPKNFLAINIFNLKV